MIENTTQRPSDEELEHLWPEFFDAIRREELIEDPWKEKVEEPVKESTPQTSNP